MDIFLNNFYINISTSTVFFCIPPKFLEHIIPHPFLQTVETDRGCNSSWRAWQRNPWTRLLSLRCLRWMEDMPCRVELSVSGYRIHPPRGRKKNHGYVIGGCRQNPGNPKRVTLQPRLETKKNPFEPSKPPSSGNKNIFIFQGVDPGSVLF